jgi:hypothetical protein
VTLHTAIRPAITLSRSQNAATISPFEERDNGNRSGAMITPIQCRMARIAVGFGIRDLAAAAKVSTDTVSRFERGEELMERTIGAIHAALEAAGVEFIAENGGGPGVRLKKRRPSE